MTVVFRDRARDVVQSNGTLALLPFMLHVIRDWSTTVPQERLAVDMTHRLNRVSSIVLTVLSLTALAPVIIGVVAPVLTGRAQSPEPDEGVAAHIFQLSIVALLPVGLTFLATGDWKQPLRGARQLAFPAAAVVLAFSMVFYVEHVYFPAHGYPPPRPGLPLILFRRLLAAL